jgi:hypothetical protein
MGEGKEEAKTYLKRNARFPAELRIQLSMFTLDVTGSPVSPTQRALKVLSLVSSKFPHTPAEPSS